MVNKHKQKKMKNSRPTKKNKEPNFPIEKKFQMFTKKKKRRKKEKVLQNFQEIQIFDDGSKKSVSSMAESMESGEISSSSSG